jgi:hypothetical protein
VDQQILEARNLRYNEALTKISLILQRLNKSCQLALTLGCRPIILLDEEDKVRGARKHKEQTKKDQEAALKHYVL